MNVLYWKFLAANGYAPLGSSNGSSACNSVVSANAGMSPPTAVAQVSAPSFSPVSPVNANTFASAAPSYAAAYGAPAMSFGMLAAGSPLALATGIAAPSATLNSGALPSAGLAPALQHVQSVGLSPAALNSSGPQDWLYPPTQLPFMMWPGRPRTRATKVACEICDITLNSQQQAQQHFSGKNHLRRHRQLSKSGTIEDDESCSDRSDGADSKTGLTIVELSEDATGSLVAEATDDRARLENGQSDRTPLRTSERTNAPSSNEKHDDTKRPPPPTSSVSRNVSLNVSLNIPTSTSPTTSSSTRGTNTKGTRTNVSRDSGENKAAAKSETISGAKRLFQDKQLEQIAAKKRKCYTPTGFSSRPFYNS